MRCKRCRVVFADDLSVCHVRINLNCWWGETEWGANLCKPCHERLVTTICDALYPDDPDAAEDSGGQTP